MNSNTNNLPQPLTAGRLCVRHLMLVLVAMFAGMADPAVRAQTGGSYFGPFYDPYVMALARQVDDNGVQATAWKLDAQFLPFPVPLVPRPMTVEARAGNAFGAAHGSNKSMWATAKAGVTSVAHAGSFMEFYVIDENSEYISIKATVKYLGAATAAVGLHGGEEEGGGAGFTLTIGEPNSNQFNQVSIGPTGHVSSLRFRSVDLTKNYSMVKATAYMQRRPAGAVGFEGFHQLRVVTDSRGTPTPIQKGASVGSSGELEFTAKANVPYLVSYFAEAGGVSMASIDPVIELHPDNPNAILVMVRAGDTPTPPPLPLEGLPLADLEAQGLDITPFREHGLLDPPATTDVTSPTTTALSPLPNANGWHRTVPVSVNLEATDSGGSGVKEVRIIRSDLTGVSIVPGSQATINVATEGITTITYYAIDKAGNSEAPKTMYVRIDTAPPILVCHESAAANPSGWHNADVSLTFVANDLLSGVAATTDSSIVTTEGANQVFHGTSTDQAGNVAAITCVLSIDKTPPTITGLPEPGCMLWPPNHQLVNVGTITAHDALSGVAPDSVVRAAHSSEPENSIGDGNSGSDVVIDKGSVWLRAERSGGGAGRIYTIDVAASDLAGNEARAMRNCEVPRGR